MSQSSDDEIESHLWIPYSERKEWSDVKPLEQNEGPDPVAKIAYSDKCKLTLTLLATRGGGYICPISYLCILIIHV